MCWLSDHRFVTFCRDPGIVTEFSNTLVEFSMRTIPKSVFPYDVVPMTRLDPITKEQVVMDLRTGLSDDHDERMHGTIIRFKNPSIVTNNFAAECPGMGRSKVLEDEMYMTTVFMIAKDIGCRWYEVPIDRWMISLNVAFDVSYPFIRYDNAISWLDKTRGHLGTGMEHCKCDLGCVFMNPSRRSIMLWAITDESLQVMLDNGPETLDEMGWKPQCTMLHEFTVSNATGDRTTRCKTIDDAMRCVFSMGFGPCPYFRRSGAAIFASRAEGQDDDPCCRLVGCIVPHRPGLHGCIHSEFRRCYMCPNNPFCEVLFGEEEDPVRVTPMRAACRALEVGAVMLLSVESKELQALVTGANLRVAAKRSKKRRRFRYSREGVPAMVHAEDQEADISLADTTHIVVRLDIQRSFAPNDGMIYVAMEVTYSNNKAAVDSRGLYVRPYDLSIVDQAMWPAGVKSHIML